MLGIRNNFFIAILFMLGGHHINNYNCSTRTKTKFILANVPDATEARSIAENIVLVWCSLHLQHMLNLPTRSNHWVHPSTGQTFTRIGVSLSLFREIKKVDTNLGKWSDKTMAWHNQSSYGSAILNFLFRKNDWHLPYFNQSYKYFALLDLKFWSK